MRRPSTIMGSTRARRWKNYLVKPFGFNTLNDKLTAYRSMRLQMEALKDQADQSDVDALFGLLRGPATLPSVPVKGHSAPTLELIRDAVRSAPGPISAAEVAEQVGVSRATAQRYLSYLTQHGIVRLQLRYGVTGRLPRAPLHGRRAVISAIARARNRM